MPRLFQRKTFVYAAFLAVFLVLFGFRGEVGAAELLSACTAETGRSVNRLTRSAVADCNTPYGAKVERIVLDYELREGGDIYVQNVKVVSFPATGGSRTGRMNISPDLAGSRVRIWLDAVNGVKSGGVPAGEVFGRATLEFWGTANAAAIAYAQSPSPPGYAEVHYPYPPGPDFSWLNGDTLKADWQFSFRSNAESADSRRFTARTSDTVGRMPWYVQVVFMVFILVLFVVSYFFYRYDKSKGLIGGPPAS